MPHARRDDPETSHAAARSVKELTKKQMSVLLWLQKHGPMTDREMVTSYGGMQNSVYGYRWPKQSESGLRSRRSELAVYGMVYDTGRRKVNENGRREIVWEARTNKELSSAETSKVIQEHVEEHLRQRQAEHDADVETRLFDPDGE